MAVAPKALGAADKVIVANRAGMTAKYGAAGVASIQAALSRLIAVDAARGLTTIVLNIDDQTQMSAFGVAPIINAADQSGVKRTVDAIDAKITPDYFLLLDGPDVVPHITMSSIPGLTDSDQNIPGDLPFASAAPFGNNASAYLAVTRVVGRLPMTKGSSDAAAFAKIIDLATQQTPRPLTAYSSFFAMSAESWKISTQLNLSALFGTHDPLSVSPADGHNGIDPSLRLLTHLINCHGATNDTRYYGQSGTNFPVAMQSNLVAPHLNLGTVAAAECCYGAEIFDPALSGAGGDPMSMVYLAGGAAAFVGSTSMSYGPPNSNAQADLMVQYFIDALLKGASTGRAMLQARQRFINTQKMSDPVNLKTLAQFVLFGDPSIVPVAVTPGQAPAGAVAAADAPAASAKDLFNALSTGDDASSARKSRRMALKSEGSAVASAATFLGRQVRTTDAVKARVEAVAKQRGFSGSVELFNVDGGATFRRVAKSAGRQPRIAVTTQLEVHVDGISGSKHTLVRVLVAHILGDGIVSLDESVSR
ncbi:C25 family cysteine peptidase [Bradyrhizobium sp. RT4b]|uniref:C25 family cysteine peptidase n=1 Tax=Bradyrhizobium sp. RT4b TaxID=3156379 RepID=UPI00339A7823